jgi:hypothetical protein
MKKRKLSPPRTGSLLDRKGELFGYVAQDRLFTLDDEPAGYVEGDLIVDLAHRPIWRIIGDGFYLLDALEPVGYFSSAPPEEW